MYRGDPGGLKQLENSKADIVGGVRVAILDFWRSSPETFLSAQPGATGSPAGGAVLDCIWGCQ
jgi:hypothetical protein